MQESKRLSVSISFGERGTLYGCGHALDTMLYAHGLNTEESLFEWISDREYEAIDQILNEYDWEACILEKLNVMPSKSEEFLHGDYLRFEEPELFAHYAQEAKRKVSDAVRESVGDWTNPELPRDLVKALERSRDYIADEAQREWLEGDRNNPGALQELAKALFGRYTEAEASWEPKTDIVTINAPGEEWREWLGYELDEREPLPDAKEIGEKIKAYTLKKAAAIKDMQARKTRERVEDYKRREAIKAEQLEKEKEEARKRKAQKDQAS